MPWSVDTPLGIDPKVDIVFHLSFGATHNEDILVRFLNDVLREPVPIVSAKVQNPFVRAVYAEQRTMVLDIRATDQSGRQIGVEMQRRVQRGWAYRALFGASRLFTTPLKKGEDYVELQHTVVIWVCEDDVFPDREPHLTFTVRDHRGRELIPGAWRIEVLQVGRYLTEPEALIADPARPWYAFFNEAAHWRMVPPGLATPALERAMSELEEIAKDPQLEHMYRQRETWERLERGRQRALEEAERALAIEREAREAAEKGREAAEKGREAAEKGREALEAEIAALRAELARKGGPATS